MSSDINDHVKKSWPRGSLERVLAREFPGCSSLLEAFQKAINRKPSDTASQSTEIEQAMTQAMSIISEATKDFDIDRISLQKRNGLANMPLGTISEINIWRDLWLKTIEEAKW